MHDCCKIVGLPSTHNTRIILEPGRDIIGSWVTVTGHYLRRAGNFDMTSVQTDGDLRYSQCIQLLARHAPAVKHASVSAMQRLCIGIRATMVALPD